MAVGGIGDTPTDIGHDREWRVHQHHGRDGIRGQMIIDLGGIEPGDGKGRKELAKKIGAGLGQFVED